MSAVLDAASLASNTLNGLRVDGSLVLRHDDVLLLLVVASGDVRATSAYDLKIINGQTVITSVLIVNTNSRTAMAGP